MTLSTTAKKFALLFAFAFPLIILVLTFRFQEKVLSLVQLEVGDKSQVSSLISQRSSSNFNDISKWANSIDVLVKEDERRVKMLLENSVESTKFRDTFYKVLNMPCQSSCSIGKFFGGHWLPGCGSFDGNKYVCMDHLYEDVKNGNCLIYSFGISNDWSFEEAMVTLGCKIRTFDPTIDGSSKPLTDLITFDRIGLSHARDNIEKVGPVQTLKDAIEVYGELNKTISYLKVDIEGSELKAIPEWISSGVLENVRQIGIEFHTNCPEENVNNILGGLGESMKSLYHLGFRIISTTTNNCVGVKADYASRYYTFMEVVFYKP